MSKVIALIPLMVLLSACASRPPTTRAPLDDFAPGSAWSIDAAANYAALSTVDNRDGGYGLRVEFVNNGRGNMLIRREVDDDYSAASALRLDLRNDCVEPGVTAAITLRSASGDEFTTASHVIKSGWNRDLRFALPAMPIIEREHIARLTVVLTPGKNNSGTVILEKLDADGSAIVREPTAQFAEPPKFSGPLVRGVVCELPVTVDYPTSPVMGLRAPDFARMTAVSARFAAPDGSLTTVRGFCTGIETVSGATRYRFAVRFRPRQAGVWSYSIGVPGRRALWTPPATVVCGDEAETTAFIRRDAQDTHAFAYESGEPYYPVGQNIAWAGDYRPYVDAISGYGGNWLRFWTCPWNLPIGAANRLNVVDQASAAGIDGLFAQARAHGIALQMTLFYHGWLGSDWNRCPFNVANGGPCARAEEFWTKPEARALFQRYLDYVVARWAPYTQLFAWELMNEVEFAPHYADEDLVAWHRVMASYLKAIDPWNHIVTTSTGSVNALPALWRIDAIDSVQVHAYQPDVAAMLAEVEALAQRVDKPVLLAEVGRGWEPKHDQVDPLGRHLRQSLWLGTMSPLAGAPMPWWWDTYIEPNSLVRVFSPVAAFWRGEDRRGQRLRVWRDGIAGVTVQVLAGDDRAYGYVFTAAAVAEPTVPLLTPLLRAGRTLTITGLTAGAWRVEWWDGAHAAALSSANVTATADGMILTLPEVGEDLAFKLKRAGHVAPAVKFSP